MQLSTQGDESGLTAARGRPTAASRGPAAPAPARVGAALGVVLLAVGSVLLAPGVPGAVAGAVANLAEVVLAALAAAAAVGRAATCVGRRRAAWLAIGAGCAGWAAGQALWTWYELAAEREAPFPSLADVGFLAFPVGMSVGLWLYTDAGAWRQSRRVLDALTVTAALTLASWSVLEAVVAAGGDQPLALFVALAYPAGDLVVAVLAILLLAASRSDRTALGLLAGGATAFALADAGFAYRTATGTFTTGDVVDLGWMAGFALLTVAAAATRERSSGEEHGGAVVVGQSVLPYLAILAAAAVVVVRRLGGDVLGEQERLLVVVVLVLVLARQFTMLRENRVLVRELAGREAELRHLAFHDALTGLANRALFLDRLDHALELHRRDLRPLAVALCDLDDFKVVNDTCGHGAGDELLVRVAERLRGGLRPADTLARLGGDEFAVLLEHGDDADLVAGRLVDALSAPFVVDGSPLRLAASVGLAVVAADEPTPDRGELLVRADTAMYSAKRAGKGVVRVHQPGMSLAEVEEQRLADALRAALEAGEVEVVHQPVVAVATGQVQGLECLARWTWDGRVVPPSAFVPVAERSGLVDLLTDHVLDVALQRLAGWHARLGDEGISVAVNVAPQDLAGRTLPSRVRRALDRWRVPADRLVLEVTESALLPDDDDAARQAARALAGLGVRLALDDFGVGYSSLAHLSSIPLDVLKVDRAFVAGLGSDPAQERFVRALLGLGRDLGLRVVAEGVERPEQLAVLAALGCDAVQGYLLSPPVPADEVPALLAAPLVAAVVPPRRPPADPPFGP